jgi:hypothetical protein
MTDPLWILNRDRRSEWWRDQILMRCGKLRDKVTRLQDAMSREVDTSQLEVDRLNLRILKAKLRELEELLDQIDSAERVGRRALGG